MGLYSWNGKCEMCNKKLIYVFLKKSSLSDKDIRSLERRKFLGKVKEINDELFLRETKIIAFSFERETYKGFCSENHKKDYYITQIFVDKND